MVIYIVVTGTMYPHLFEHGQKIDLGLCEKFR